MIEVAVPRLGDGLRIAVVDHGAGNLVSIAQGLAHIGAAVTVADVPSALSGADGIVLPGVGATAAAMRRLEAAGFIEPLRHLDVPLLGICVGMQVLFDASDEDGASCLGLIPGIVRELAAAPTLPHMGWNDIDLIRADPLFAGITDPVFYFVHSFAPDPLQDETIVGRSHHGADFVSAVRCGNVAGVQFHPERSGAAGLRLLANFAAECDEMRRAA